MSRKKINTQARTAPVKRRKCSVCRKPGHTKRTCPTKRTYPIKSKEIGKKNCHVNQKFKYSSDLGDKSFPKTAHIFVKVLDKAQPSPHVVEIEKEDHKKHWKKAEVYYEPFQKEERKTIDVAAIVRATNDHKRKIVSRGLVPKKKLVRAKIRLTFNAQQLVRNIKGLSLEEVSSRASNRARESVLTIYDDASSGLYRIKRRFKFVVPSLRLVAGTMTVLILVSIPFPAIGYYQTLKEDTQKVIQESTNAFLSLQSSTVAALETNLAQARYDLSEALQAFHAAESFIEKEHRALIYVARLLPYVGTKIESRQNLLLAGHHLALGNSYLVKGVDEATQTVGLSNSDRLSVLRNHMRSALPQYEEALENLGKVESSSLPAMYQEPFAEFKLLFATFIDDMHDLVGVMKALGIVLGEDEFKRYLIVFQNHHELRPTGGFIGSFAVIDVQKGKIMDIDLPGGGSYDVQGQLDTYLKPPLPLQLVNYRWHFHDANWFPDFEASAKKLAWFYQHSRNTTVDGVVAVNASVLPRIMRVIGPISDEGAGLFLDADNILEKLQYEVEENYDKDKNQPKEVLAELLDELILMVQKIKPHQLLSLVVELDEAFAEKEVQVYSADEKVQDQFRSFGWTGEIISTEKKQDYLMVVNTNVGGGKSDAKIKQHISHKAEVQSDGSVINTVRVVREHKGKENEKFYGNPNIDYVRIYVPKGARLIEANGFSFPKEEAFLVPEEWYEDDEDLASLEREESLHIHTGTRVTGEFGKTCFGNWIFTKPGEISEIYIKYRLPFKVFNSNVQEREYSRYSLIAQKQSGIESSFSHSVVYSDDWFPIWKVNNTGYITPNGMYVDDILKTDKAYGIVMEKQ